MKPIKLLLCASLALCVSALGQVITAGVTAATTAKQVVTNGAAVLSFSVTDTSGALNYVYMRDNDNSALASGTNRALPSYTVVVSYPTNRITTYTNIAEVVYSVTNTVQYTAQTVQATNLAPARLMNLFVVPASGTVTWYPDSPQGATYGIQLYSLAATAYKLEYLTLP